MDANILIYRLVEITFFVVFLVCLRDAWRVGRDGDEDIDRIEDELEKKNCETPGQCPGHGPADALTPRAPERWRKGNYLWIGIMIAAMVFTFTFEYVLTHKAAPGKGPGTDSIYSYEVPALVNLGGVKLPDGKEKAGSAVPLWIPCGWALIIYLVMRTSDKLNLLWYKRPVLDGLMALVIDFALDPVASWNHWWVWDFSLKPELEPTLFFTIPATNYMAWIVIVAGFSFSVRLLQRWREGRYTTPVGKALSWFLQKLPRGLVGDLLTPLLASAPAFLMVIGYSKIGRWFMSTTGPYSRSWFTDGALICSLVWAACLVWVYLDAPIARRDHKHDFVLMLSPLALYAVVVLALYTTKVPANDPTHGGSLLYEAMPELVIIVPLSAILGCIVFAWPYSKPGPESWW